MATSRVKLKPLSFVRTVLKSFMAESGLEPRLLGPTLRIKDAREGVVDFELGITKDHLNRLQIIHGGTIASMVDLGGSLAVASKGYYSTGVSTDLNVTYISSGGREGNTLKATAVYSEGFNRTDNQSTVGKTLAYTTVTFWDEQRNLVARGSHTKFVAQAVASSEPFVPPQGTDIAQ